MNPEGTCSFACFLPVWVLMAVYIMIRTAGIYFESTFSHTGHTGKLCQMNQSQDIDETEHMSPSE